ncbi:ankyrin repeats (3 copies) domain-containing protein [Ditylenchus destructor]|uniref:Ankyrin repeats (3 copies) domain-containing protein n=1 Tax=Ditylenchus destructor TaxID=166010 RepID=A0AAD4MZ74_9BILA|nr:ankyrin repeats (3 copies) domain-containing protein [Ditylenchus destructor]
MYFGLVLVLVVAMILQGFVASDELHELFDIIEDASKTHHDLNNFLEGEGKGVDINGKIAGQTVLNFAVFERDDADIVECLLQHKADKDALNNNGSTPLMIAVLYNRENSAEVLLKHKARTDLKYTGMDTVLGTAVSSGFTNIVKSLINHGVDPSVKSSVTGFPMVHTAARMGQADTLKALLEHEAKLEVNKDKTNKTPSISETARNMNAIQWAVDQGKVEAVKVLLKYDHDALKKIQNDELYGDGSTLLLLAAVRGHLDVVKELVEKYGANVELKGKLKWNKTPVDVAKDGRSDIQTYLVEKIKEKREKKGKSQ